MRPIRTSLAALALVLAFVGAAVASEDVREFPPQRRAEAESDLEVGLRAARVGDWPLSIHYLERYVARDPQDVDALTYLGVGNSKLGKLGKAITYFDAALSIDPDQSQAHAYIGKAYLAAGEPALARQQEATLAGICASGCRELDKLRRAIRAYKTKGAGS